MVRAGFATNTRFIVACVSLLNWSRYELGYDLMSDR